MVYPIAEPSLGDPVEHADAGRMVAALALSIAVHASVLAWTPILRLVPDEPPPVISVELAPKVEPNVEPVAPPPEPIPEVKPEPEPPPPEPEPIVERVPEPPPEPEPEPEPKPEPPPKPKPVKKKPAPIKAPPPPEPPPVVAEPPPRPIATSPVPEAPPPVFSVPVEPTPPIVVPPEPVKPQPVDDEVIEGYEQTLTGVIGKQQRYPGVARMRNWQGIAVVLIKFAPGGSVRDVSIAQSSGFDILDEEALEMVKRARPLPQPPANLGSREFSVRVPIRFRLTR